MAVKLYQYTVASGVCCNDIAALRIVSVVLQQPWRFFCLCLALETSNFPGSVSHTAQMPAMPLITWKCHEFHGNVLLRMGLLGLSGPQPRVQFQLSFQPCVLSRLPVPSAISVRKEREAAECISWNSVLCTPKN